jgi:hypothetical protein
MNVEAMTHDEMKAIAALKRLGKRWPGSLLLFATGNALGVRKPSLNGGAYDCTTEVATIEGIPNDGGDGGDKFQ